MGVSGREGEKRDNDGLGGEGGLMSNYCVLVHGSVGVIPHRWLVTRLLSLAKLSRRTQQAQSNK